jgi:glutaredoxin
MLIFFYREECPYCQKVLKFFEDNDVEFEGVISPSGSASREIVKKLGEDISQVPFLLDTDRGEWMFESDDIIDYVNEYYS